MSYIGRALTPKLVAGRTANPRPTFEFNAATGVLPSGVTFTRASGATYTNYRGYLQTAATDVLRYAYDPTLPYNLLPNPWGDDASQWETGNSASVGFFYQGSGIRNGIPYSRWRVLGTSSGSGFPNLRFNKWNGVIPALVGDAFSGEAFVEVVRVGATNTADVTAPTVSLAGYASGGAQTEVSSTANIAGRTFADGPLRIQRTLVNGTTASVVLRLTVPNAVGLVHDWDFDIGFPVLNRGLSYLTDTVPLATLAYRVGTMPQYGLQGALLEEASSNEIADGSTVSAWTATRATLTASAGVAPNGATEMTRFADTTDAGSHNITTTGYSVTSGETWTLSAYVRAETVAAIQLIQSSAGFGTEVWATFDLVNNVVGSSGSLTTAQMVAVGGGVYRISISGAATTTVTSAPLIYLQNSAAATRAASYTGTVQSCLIWGIQSERQPFPTSYIATTGATATRARDTFPLPLTILGAARGTMAARIARLPGGNEVTTKYGPTARASTIPNGLVGFFWNAGSERPTMQINSGGANVATRTPSTGTHGDFFSGSIAWGDGSAIMSWNGEAGVVDGSAPSPATFTAIAANGIDISSTGTACFILRFLRVWNNTKLSAAQVQRQSARTE